MDTTNTHDAEKPHDMLAEAACRFGSLMETALLHHLTRTMDTTDTQPLPTPSELRDEISGFSRELTDVAETVARSAYDKINKAIEEMILPDEELTHPNNATWEDRKMPPQLPKTL